MKKKKANLVIHKHLFARMQQRGVTKDEIQMTLKDFCEIMFEGKGKDKES